MKTLMLYFFVALALPAALEALVVRPPDAPVSTPRIECNGGSDEKTAQGAYETAFRKAFLTSISSQLFKASNGMSQKLQKLDLDGNGILDCKELELITRELEDPSVGKPSEKDTQRKVSHVFENIAATARTASLHMLVAGQPDVTAEMNKENRKIMKEMKEMDGKASKRKRKDDAGDEDTSKKGAVPPAGVQASPSSVPSSAPGPAPACTPRCTWHCGTASCDEVCEPKCQNPQCETRCTGMSTNGCVMKCGQPRCQSVCNHVSISCPSKKCPVCQTQCGKPMCKLVCPPGVQKCRDVCESPACAWKCSAPKVCPKPQCELKCDSPKECIGGPGASYKELPPLMDGETVVQSYEMPLSFQQHQDGTLKMPVPVKHAVAVPGHSELKIEQRIVMLPVVMQ